MMEPSGGQTLTVAQSGRADARENRARVLSAAAALFTTEGWDLQVAAVAQAAGVAVATVYRNFPSKQSLLATLAAERYSACVRASDAALAEGCSPQALRSFFEEIGRLIDSDAGLRSMILGLPLRDRPCQQGEMAARLAALHASARKGGVLADDIEVEDLQVIISAITGAVGAGAPVPRIVDLILRGVIHDHHG
jgi:AcrR family transcriptional regulator